MMSGILVLLLPFLLMQSNEGSCCKCEQSFEKSAALICFNKQDMRAHVDHFEPIHPPGLDRQLNISGVVEIEVRYSPKGKVECIRTISGHPIAVSATMESIEKWTFKPAKTDGIPTWCCGRIVIEYSFRNGNSTSRLK
jgi:hypothetical protein